MRCALSRLIAVVVVLFVTPVVRAEPVVTPVGTFQVPDGCRGGKIDWGLDAFMGTIECPKHQLSLLVFGGAGGVADPCKERGPQVRDSAQERVLGEPLRFSLEGGVAVTVCRKQRLGAADPKGIREIVAGIGPEDATLSATATRPEHVFLLLQILTSFRRVASTP
ncbi:MAG TPA: hypothetical protein VII13_06450 [Vicinamibacteria bacterium]|jgi:hypothetical protein